MTVSEGVSALITTLDSTIPDSVEPRIGTLRYELGCPTPETTRKLYDEMDFQRAVQSSLWGYPAVSFESIRHSQAGLPCGSTSHGCTGSTLGGGHFTPFG